MKKKKRLLIFNVHICFLCQVYVFFFLSSFCFNISVFSTYFCSFLSCVFYLSTICLQIWITKQHRKNMLDGREFKEDEAIENKRKKNVYSKKLNKIACHGICLLLFSFLIFKYWKDTRVSKKRKWFDVKIL